MNDQKGGWVQNQPVTFTGMNVTTSELLIGVRLGVVLTHAMVHHYQWRMALSENRVYSQ